MFKFCTYSCSEFICFLGWLFVFGAASMLEAQQPAVLNLFPHQDSNLETIKLKQSIDLHELKLISSNSKLRPIAFQLQESFDLKKPPLSKNRIAYEMLAGEVVVFTTVALFLNKKPTNGFVGLFTTSLLAFVGASLGSSGGVFLVGSMEDETSSFKKTLRGSLISSGIASLLAVFITKKNDTRLAITFAAMPIGATVSFNLNRRYK